MTPEKEKVHHFLIVDDDEESRKTVVEYLRAMGYEKISSARDGAEASILIDRDPSINFVISDWDMPMMNGISLLQKIRSTPSRSNMPFLIMTSPISHEAEKVIQAAESYVDAYVIKPFRSNLLKEKVETMLKQSVHGAQKQALVVDDDNDAREMVVEYLKQLGFREVHSEKDGKAALKYLTEHMKDVGLIISDWEMPEMTGIELLKLIKAHPELSEIPFLMITSQSSMERMKVIQAAQAQVDQYLLKPFQMNDIKKKVDALLERSKSRKQVMKLSSEASILLEKGSYLAAIGLFEEAILLDPTHDPSLRGLGDAMFKTKGVATAVPLYKRAVEANPLNARNYLRLAAAYEQMGLLDKGIALLLSGIHQVSFSADLHFHLGKLYNRKGAGELAKIEFEKTLEIQLDHQEARIMLDMIKSRENE
jgi:two-component system chemotaxis response regulator CheY